MMKTISQGGVANKSSLQPKRSASVMVAECTTSSLADGGWQEYNEYDFSVAASDQNVAAKKGKQNAMQQRLRGSLATDAGRIIG